MVLGIRSLGLEFHSVTLWNLHTFLHWTSVYSSVKQDHESLFPYGAPGSGEPLKLPYGAWKSPEKDRGWASRAHFKQPGMGKQLSETQTNCQGGCSSRPVSRVGQVPSPTSCLRKCFSWLGSEPHFHWALGVRKQAGLPHPTCQVGA